MPTGTHTIADLLAARFTPIPEFGVDSIVQTLQADLGVWNRMVLDGLSDLAEVSTDRLRRYGTSASGEMTEVDEFGRGPTQKVVTGATVGFPLRKFQYPVGWTRDWLESRTPADLAQLYLSAQKAHMKAILRDIKRAIYGPTNVTFQDHLIDRVDLAVKAFVNADGQPIPEGPNGEVFDGAVHTHYDAIAAMTSASLKSLINDVVEHGNGSRVYLAINKADEDAVRAFTPDFVPYPDPRLVIGANVTTTAKTLDVSRLDNRAIGIIHGAEVWVKPWALQSYPFAWDAGAAEKPLVFRQRNSNRLQGLRLAATIDMYPLQAEYMVAEFGIGVWNRTNGAVLYTAGGAYVAPTIN